MAKVQSTRMLSKCPEWPTSHTLPKAVVTAIERCMWRLRATGRPARRQDVLGLAIMFFAPGTPSELIAIMTKPHPQLRGTVGNLPTGRYRGVLTANSEQLMVRLPSPVTLRLNALVDQLLDQSFPATRRQVVSAVMLHCVPRKADELADAYDLYLVAPAGTAAIPGQPVSTVLSLDRPKPGRRPRPA